MLPELPAVLRPDVRGGARQGARAALRAGLQRLDGRGVVREDRAAGCCRCASCRCGTPTSRSRRSNATRRAACAPVAFSEIPAYLGLPSVHSGYWERFFATCAATGTVLCLHIGSGDEDAAHVRRRAGRRLGQHGLRQLRRLAGRLHLLRRARTPSRAPARLQRGPDRLDPVLPRTGRRRLADPQRWSTITCASPNGRRPTTTGRCTAASSRTSTASSRWRAVGVDNVTFETDYPHADSTWPHTKKLASEMFAGPRRRDRPQGRPRQRDPPPRAGPRVTPLAPPSSSPGGAPKTRVIVPKAAGLVAARCASGSSPRSSRPVRTSRRPRRSSRNSA